MIQLNKKTDNLKLSGRKNKKRILKSEEILRGIRDMSN